MKCISNIFQQKMGNNFKILTFILLSLFSIDRILADDLGVQRIRSQSDNPILVDNIGSRRIRSRSDIPIEDEDLVGYREMDGEIKKDLNRFDDIKQVFGTFRKKFHLSEYR